MVLSIGDVELVTVERHSLRTEKAGRHERTADHALGASADYVNQSPIKFGDYDAVVVRISDEEPSSFLISQNFAGKCERQVANFRFFQHQLQRRLVQFTAFAKFRDGIADYFIKSLVTAFARKSSEHVSRGVNQVSGPPGVNGIGLPNLEIRVIDDRVLDLVTQNDAANVFRILLVFEFC